MEKILGTKLSREALAHVLGLTALFALVGAFFLDRFGVRSHGLSPVAFVLVSMTFLSLAFVAWPSIIAKISKFTELNGSRGIQWSPLARTGLVLTRWISGRKTPHYFQNKTNVVIRRNSTESSATGADRRRQNLRSENDPRLRAAIFAANVPTFILDADQRFIDWNPAFHLVFRRIKGLKRGSHVSQWFKSLENFKRVPKRSSELYGEAILPMADRERVSYDSEEWGRMVFVKIMTPILDRKNGCIIGWTVVLNINSVGRRVEFFEELYAKISRDTQRRFYAACYDHVFSQDSTRCDLIAAHTSNLGPAKKVLDVGAFTGELTCRLAREGRFVTTVEGEVHLLRRIADKTAGYGARVRIVKKNPRDLQHLPESRFDGVTLLLTINRWADPTANLKKIRAAMSDRGTLTMSAIVSPHTVETIFNTMRHEMAERGRFDALKDQFNHVLEHERQEAHSIPFRYRSLEELRQIAQDAGFTIEKEFTFRTRPDYEDALVLLVLKK
jgi:2-polyprenyl-3-methyl-5-hydroxy-6-metoxy-1,4-benzoquinol methylase/PAS domain-containing protein